MSQGYGPKSGLGRGGNHGSKMPLEKDWKYNGDFHSLPVFNQRVESEVAEKSTLAEMILKGHLEVKEESTAMGLMFRHAGGLLTNLLLAIVIVTSADPEATRARLGTGFKDIGTQKDGKVRELLSAIYDEGPIDYRNVAMEDRLETWGLGDWRTDS